MPARWRSSTTPSSSTPEAPEGIADYHIADRNVGSTFLAHELLAYATEQGKHEEAWQSLRLTGRADLAGRCRSQESGRSQTGADMIVGQRPDGIWSDLSAEQVRSGALEPEHVKWILALADMATEPAGRGMGQVGDAVPGGGIRQCAGARRILLQSAENHRVTWDPS